MLILLILSHFEMGVDSGINFIIWEGWAGYGFNHSVNIYWEMENKLWIISGGSIEWARVNNRSNILNYYAFQERFGIGKQNIKKNNKRHMNFFGGIILGKFSFNYDKFQLSPKLLVIGGFGEVGYEIKKIKNKDINLYLSINSYLNFRDFVEFQVGINIK